ncbi:MAG: metallophosphoesterase family protein [Chloroflexi bacterium]|nr:metallophosphoesterase family protein [Chloroflexota bacterium]
MRIGLISDTHVPAATYEIPYQVARAFAGVDLILHAGDIYAPFALDWLERIAPVYAVLGGSVDRMDGDPRMAERHLLTLEGVSLGLIHMLTLPGLLAEVFPGTIGQLFPHHQSVRKAVQHVFNHPVDVVVFGDTHYETLEWHDGVLFVNPGSPTLPRQMRRLGHVALLDIDNGRVEGRIVDLNEYTVAGMPEARWI